MNTSDVVLLSALIFCAVLLYSAVGHGGAAILGGMIGSGLGSRRFSSMTLRRLLASVLVIAGLKFVCTQIQVHYELWVCAVSSP